VTQPGARDSLDEKHWPIAAATVHAMAYEDHWLPGFNFNVEEWDAKGLRYETLAICRSLALARAEWFREQRSVF
jgi:hypothetical protein